MDDIQKLTDILMDELPEDHPWQGEIRKLRDRLIAKGVTVRERGRWEKISHYPYYCSCCGEIAPLDCEGESHYKSNFCPNCGADMRGEEDGA